MGTLWTKGPSSIRELQEAFPEKERPAYTTVQTVVYRLEFKKAIRRTEKISNATPSATAGSPCSTFDNVRLVIPARCATVSAEYLRRSRASLR